VPLAGYRVRPGQTLTDVARAVGTPLFALMDANGLDLAAADRVRAGTVVRVPTARFAGLAQRAGGRARRPLAFELHPVAPGESVASIERRHGLAAGELSAWNELPGGPLQEGLLLSVPLYR
jgi:LysM repeat protein